MSLHSSVYLLGVLTLIMPSINELNINLKIIQVVLLCTMYYIALRTYN
jgi:hypothetical protein